MEYRLINFWALSSIGASRDGADVTPPTPAENFMNVH
jgi:hypothetical protein